MSNRLGRQTRQGAAGRLAGNRAGRPGGGFLRLFGQRAPTTMGSPAPNQFGHFADSWMSRLLIGAALLLLVVMFPLQWLRTPTLVVRSNVGTFAPRPGATGDTAAGSVTASYDLSEEAQISAQVYDSAGATVKTLL